jgi:hypothetical protein
MKSVALVLGLLFSLVGGACVLLVAFAAVSSGLWGLGHFAPILLIGILAFALVVLCLLFGAKVSRTPQS